MLALYSSPLEGRGKVRVIMSFRGFRETSPESHVVYFIARRFHQ